jgi:hypothetical protein
LFDALTLVAKQASVYLGVPGLLQYLPIFQIPSLSLHDMSTAIIPNSQTEQSNLVNALIADNQELTQWFEIAPGSELSAMELSPDGRYLATGNIWGRTTVSSHFVFPLSFSFVLTFLAQIRDTAHNSRKVLLLNSGRAARISALAWLPISGDKRTLFVAACNGYINSVCFTDDSLSNVSVLLIFCILLVKTRPVA